MDKRTNAGYDIIQVIAFPDEEYVLGVKTVNDKQQYVTWCCVNKTDYYYGHYFSNYKLAVKDLYERAKKYIDWTLENLI